jgi:hypothetical protein
MNVLLKNQPSFPDLLPKSATAVPMRPLSMEAADFVKLAELRAKYPDLKEMTPAAFAEVRRQSQEKRAAARAEMAAMDEEMKRLDRELSETRGAKEAIEWGAVDPVMERPAGSMFKDLRKAVVSGDCHSFYVRRKLSTFADYETEILRHAEVFVVEHDWAQAFATAEVKDAPVRLPYDVCAFEFQYGGRPIVALATQFESEVVYSAAVKGPLGWVLCDFACDLRATSKAAHGFSRLLGRIASQISAISIALDADVAKDEIVREQYHGAASTRNYAVPKGYHVVSLSRRSARALATGHHSGRRVRLHFRRGHWRHFENHKTWIKWMLVGDPELGFIDKHYKL